MKNYLTIIFFFITTQTLIAAKIRVYVYTNISGTELYHNGKLIQKITSEAPEGYFAYLRLKIDTKYSSNKDTLTLKKDGYEEKHFPLNSLRLIRNTRSIIWTMKKKRTDYSKFLKNKKTLVNHSDIKLNIKSGQNIMANGKEPIYTEQNLTNINVKESFGPIILKELKKNNILVSNNNEEISLFNKKVSEPEEADLLIGAIINSLEYDYMTSVNLPGVNFIYIKCKMNIEWQIYDTYKSEIVFKSSSNYEGISYYVNEVNDALNQSFQENFAKLLSNQKSIDFLANYQPVKEKIEINGDINLNLSNVLLTKKNTRMKEINNSVVTIKTLSGHGSGIIISEDGYILTSHHVIKGKKNVKVILPMGLELNGKVIKSDVKSDITLIKVKGNGFNNISIYSGEYSVGEDVYAVGTPSNIKLKNTLTKGIISSKRKLDDKDLIQIDVSVSPGNSGGALVNSFGQAIGVINSKIIDNGVEGLGFATPIVKALESLEILSSENK